MLDIRKIKWRKWILVAVVTVAVVMTAFAVYLVDYSLDYPVEERRSAEEQTEIVEKECPWIVGWVDSVKRCHALRDTFVQMKSGYKAHALYVPARKPSPNTALVVHGYKCSAERMLHIAYLYHHDMGYNVLLPDLYGHGRSEGDHIQMGWLDRWDVLQWADVAQRLFGSTGMVMHGISMGAATVMCAAGENTPGYVKCFVEDCGYTFVWEEFEAQLKAQFGLDGFPLMDMANQVCWMKYDWPFLDACPREQVGKCHKPMLFIHGDKDDYVPTWMVYDLYKAKPGVRQLYIGRGSAHAYSYRDHRDEYTRTVARFVSSAM